MLLSVENELPHRQLAGEERHLDRSYNSPRPCGCRRLRCLVGPLLLLVAVGWFVFDSPSPHWHGIHAYLAYHHPNNEVDIDSRYRDHWAPRYRHYHHFLIRAICLSTVLGMQALFFRCRRPASGQRNAAGGEHDHPRHGLHKVMNPRRALILLLVIFSVLILLQAFVAVPPPTPPPQVLAALAKKHKRVAATVTVTDALEYVRRVVFDLPSPRGPMGEDDKGEKDGDAAEKCRPLKLMIIVDPPRPMRRADHSSLHSETLRHVPFGAYLHVARTTLHAMWTTVGRMLLAGVVPPPPPVLPILDDATSNNSNTTVLLYCTHHYATTTTNNDKDNTDGHDRLFYFASSDKQHTVDRIFKIENSCQTQMVLCRHQLPPVLVVALVVLLLTLRLALFLAIPVVLLYYLLCACHCRRAVFLTAEQECTDCTHIV